MACRFLRLIATVIAVVRLEGWDRVRRGIAAVGVVSRGFADWAGVAAGGTAAGLGSGSGGTSWAVSMSRGWDYLPRPR